MIERYIQAICDNCNKVLTFRNLRIDDVYTSIHREYERQEAEKMRLIYEEECREFERMNGD